MRERKRRQGALIDGNGKRAREGCAVCKVDERSCGLCEFRFLFSCSAALAVCFAAIVLGEHNLSRK